MFFLQFYSSGQVFGKVDYLNPMDTRQYLYCLSPKPELYKDTKVLKGVTNIGKLDIVWKTNLGEKGRLQTSQLQRVVRVIASIFCVHIDFCLPKQPFSDLLVIFGFQNRYFQAY